MAGLKAVTICNDPNHPEFGKCLQMAPLKIYKAGDMALKFTLLDDAGAQVSLTGDGTTDDLVKLYIYNANTPWGTALETISGTFTTLTSEVSFALANATIDRDLTGTDGIKYVYGIEWWYKLTPTYYRDGCAQITIA